MNIKPKYRKYIVILAVVAALLGTFFYYEASVKEKGKLCIVSTDKDYVVAFYNYDISTKDIKTYFQDEKSGYTAGVFDSKTNSLYFIRRDNDNYMQLFKRNLDSREEKQITSVSSNNIVNVDIMDINSNHSLLFMRVIQKDHRNIQMAVLELGKETVEIWDKQEEDISFKEFSYSAANNKLLAVRYSQNEEDNKRAKANESQDFSDMHCSYEICMLDPSGKTVKVLDKANRNINGIDISPNNKYLLTLEVDDSKFQEFIIFSVLRLKDLKNNNTEIINLEERGYSNVSEVKFSSNSKGIYFLANKGNAQLVKDKYNQTFKSSSIFYYDIKTKKISEVVNFKDAVINNFTIRY